MNRSASKCYACFSFKKLGKIKSKRLFKKVVPFCKKTFEIYLHKASYTNLMIESTFIIYHSLFQDRYIIRFLMTTQIFRRLFTTQIGPNQGKKFAFNSNPILFNVRNERYVVQGKERIVGAWLGLVSASIFAIVVIGGHTRLTKSGLSMVRWEPHRLLPPMNQQEWE